MNCTASSEARSIIGDNIVVVTPTVLSAPRGDATNERETISCLEINFSPYVLAFRKAFDRSRREPSFSGNTRVIRLPFLDFAGLRLLQVLVFSVFSSIALLLLRGMLKPCVVVATHPIVSSLAVPTCHLLRVPLIYRAHSTPLYSEEPPLKGTMLGELFRVFDIVAINASDLVQVSTQGAKMRIPHDRVCIIPYSVSDAFFQATPVEDDIFTIGFIGNFSQSRDFGPYLKAIKKLTQTIATIRVQLVGEGVNKRAVASTVETLGLQGIVQILPPVPHAQVPSLLSRFDVLVNPQLPENTALSQKVIEAMALGIPVITTVPQGELLRDRSTCVVVRNTEESYEEAIRLLYHDGKLRKQISQNAKRTAEAFFARSYVAELYRKAIQSVTPHDASTAG